MQWRSLTVTAVLCLLPALPARAQGLEELWQRCADSEPHADGSGVRGAIEACSGVIDSGRLNAEGLSFALAKRALALSYDDELVRALEDADRAVGLWTTAAFQFGVRGKIYEDLGRFDEALQDYGRAIAREPGNAFYYFNRGFLLEDLGDDEAALRDYDQAIALQPDDDESMRRRAVIFQDRGDLDGAIREWKRISALVGLQSYEREIYGELLFDHAMRSMEVRQYRVALDDLEGAMILPQRVGAARYWRAVIFNLLGEHSRARGEIDQVLADEPVHWTAWQERAVADIGLFEYDAALADIGRSLAIETESARSWAVRGLVLLDKGDAAGAVASCNDGLAHERNGLALAVRGVARTRQRDYDGALEDLEAALALDAEDEDNDLRIDVMDGRVLAARAEIRLRRGDYDGGLQDLADGSDRMGVRAGGYFASLRGGVEAARGGLTAMALSSYDSALSAAPDDPVALAFRGHAHLVAGDLDAALADYEHALAADPAMATALFGRGVVKQRRGESAGGDADIAAATRLFPGVAAAARELGVDASVIAAADANERIDRGVAYTEQGDLERALEEFNAAIAADPQNAVAYFDRAWVYQELRDWERAAADYTRALSIDPDHTSAYYNRGLVYSEQGRAEESAQDMTRVLAAEPADFGALKTRGAAYVRIGRYRDAITDLDAALAVDGQDPWLLFARGAARIALGDSGGEADVAAATRLSPDIATFMMRYGVMVRR